MLVSGRRAVRILLEQGAMAGEAQARALLRTGAAGRGVVTDTGVFFDSVQVLALARRPWLTRDEQEMACPNGVYLARLSRSASIDLTRPWSEVASQVDVVPRMPVMTAALLQVSVTAAGRLPWVAVLHGFVVHGADLTGFETDGNRIARFRLGPPGEWFAAWRDRRIKGTRGGRPWVIRRPRGS